VGHPHNTWTAIIVAIVRCCRDEHGSEGKDRRDNAELHGLKEYKTVFKGMTIQAVKEYLETVAALVSYCKRTKGIYARVRCVN